jgi:hypothetical protein
MMKVGIPSAEGNAGGFGVSYLMHSVSGDVLVLIFAHRAVVTRVRS